LHEDRVADAGVTHRDDHWPAVAADEADVRDQRGVQDGVKVVT
jgi:hypothetical protein